jgi:hypothetical protein
MKDAIVNTLIDLTFEEHLRFGRLGQQILNRPKIVNALTIEVLLHIFLSWCHSFYLSFSTFEHFFLILMDFSTKHIHVLSNS